MQYQAEERALCRQLHLAARVLIAQQLMHAAVRHEMHGCVAIPMFAVERRTRIESLQVSASALQWPLRLLPFCSRVEVISQPKAQKGNRHKNIS
jgi:hypothetical protein